MHVYTYISTNRAYCAPVVLPQPLMRLYQTSRATCAECADSSPPEAAVVRVFFQLVFEHAKNSRARRLQKFASGMAAETTVRNADVDSELDVSQEWCRLFENAEERVV